ncbi:MAG: hypothetical protein ACE15B_20225 [Bryobacteraceae bacterium]
MTKFLRILPHAIELARIAEAAMPLPGQGKAKLAFALDAAEAAYEAEEEMRSNWKDKGKFLESIAKAINVTVALLNAGGVFKHKAA